MTKQVSIPKLAFARFGGDIVADVGARTGTYMLKHVLAMPYNAALDMVTYGWVLPHLGQYEAKIDQLLPAVETATSREKRLSRPPEIRARKIAATMLDLGSDTAWGFVAQVAGQQVIDNWLLKSAQITRRQQSMVSMVDRAFQVGSFVMLNTAGADLSKSAQKNLAPMMQKIARGVGVEMPEETAQEWASRAMNVNATGAFGTLGALVSHYNYAKRS